MPTLSELVASGQVIRWEVDLGRRQPMRSLFLLPAAVTDLSDIGEWASQHQIDIQPIEQLDALTATFVAGETLAFQHQFWPLRPAGHGVWELKTADVRIFGWFPGRDQYIAVRVDQAWRVKEHHLYAGYKGEVVRYRDALPLAGDKFVKGADPDDVVSNFSYAQSPRRR